MHKSERINDMMLYLNNRNFFNLKDIMDRYSISKSTALRDVQSLEAIGMPIFSESGRNGRYGILQNKLLSPIIFTIDEMYALYFSMLTLKAYESTPFHLSAEILKQKFEICLSKEHIGILHKMEEILSFDVSKHHNSSPFLKDILKMSVEEKVCDIIYNKNSTEKLYTVQFFSISATYGQWYATAFNYKSNNVQVFRCDKITSLFVNTNHESTPIQKLKDSSSNIFRKKDAIDFEVQIHNKGADLFYKEHYPSMTLYISEDKYYIKGFYNKGEENFIATYFINFSDSIISIKPLKLKKLILDKLSSLKEYYQTF